MTIVIEFGKFSYNRASMGLCASGDLFQANLDSFLIIVEEVKTYMNDILVLKT